MTVSNYLLTMAVCAIIATPAYSQVDKNNPNTDANELLDLMDTFRAVRDSIDVNNVVIDEAITILDSSAMRVSINIQSLQSDGKLNCLQTIYAFRAMNAIERASRNVNHLKLSLSTARHLLAVAAEFDPKSSKRDMEYRNELLDVIEDTQRMMAEDWTLLWSIGETLRQTKAFLVNDSLTQEILAAINATDLMMERIENHIPKYLHDQIRFPERQNWEALSKEK